MPVALVASATVKEPTAVFAAPAPSVIVSVAVLVATATLASVPPLGTLASVHGAVPADVRRERLREHRGDVVDLAVGVGVLHRHDDQDGLGAVGRCGRGERGLVAGGVADTGCARGERDGEAADRRIGARLRPR